jgi:hypothetical protein
MKDERGQMGSTNGVHNGAEVHTYLPLIGVGSDISGGVEEDLPI